MNKKKKKQKHQRIRNPLVVALIKRRPKTHHIDKKKQEQHDRCRNKNNIDEDSS
jgi:hypothetical protein